MLDSNRNGYEPVGDFPVMPDEEAAALTKRQEEAQEAISRTLESVVSSLESKANYRASQRQDLEKRWLVDLYQYHGQLTPEQIELLNKSDAVSRLFVNHTRTKTNTMAARLSDLLFPTDDTNWSIEPTPIPRLTKEASRLQEMIDQMRAQAEQQQAAQAQQQAQPQPGADGAQPQAMPAQATPPAQDPQKMLEQANIYQKRLAAIQDQSAIARDAAENMTLKVKDQLVDCCYAAEARLVIEDACKIGTGIMKGPVLDRSVGMWWDVAQDGTATLRPGDKTSSIAMTRVDPWHFFPDMSRQRMSPQDGVFERHIMTESDLRKLGRSDGFDRQTIGDLIKSGARGQIPTNISALSIINLNVNSAALDGMFEVWEYHGPLAGDDLKAVAEALARVSLIEDAADRWPGDVRRIEPSAQEMPQPAEDVGENPEEEEPTGEAPDIVMEAEVSAGEREVSFADFEVDPLSEVQVVVWFCQGKLLKFELSPSERDDLPYSVYCIEPDEACPFGYGVPYMIRNTQDAFNAIMRMIMDNGGVAAGPQVIFNRKKIKPANGGDDYSIKPRKTWEFTDEISKDEAAFQEIKVDAHLGELVPILNLILKFMDDEAAIPLIAAGEQGSTQTKTMGGMTILMNAANIIFKRAVKRFDDDMTTPNIRRLFDWNMTYSDDPAIKGDSQVNAKGSSVLLVREMVASNLMIIAKEFGAHPVFGPMLKSAAVLRQIFRSQGMTVDESVYTDEELKRIAANTPKEEGDPLKMAELQLRQAEIDARVQIANSTNDTALKVASMEREKEMLKLAQQGNMNLDKIQAMLQSATDERTHKERMMAAEIGAQELQAPVAGDAAQISGKGGGGMI